MRVTDFLLLLGIGFMIYFLTSQLWIAGFFVFLLALAGAPRFKDDD